MKVALITGPCQAGKCGVGDYTVRLAVALQKACLQVDVVRGEDWKLFRLHSLVKLVRDVGADVLHLQYPTMGFGYKLGPQGLTLSVPCIVTLHEVSKAHLLRKLALYAFALRARHLIFTSDEEREFGLRWAPWLRKRSSVIPIGSNIESSVCDSEREIREVVYFGLVMPRKGIEDVLELARIIGRKRDDLRVRVVGSHRPEHAEYAARLRQRSEGLPVLWEQDLSEAQVTRRLGGAWIAYLPYPDGASGRRGGLKAALANGMAVVTTRGWDTAGELGKVVRFAATPSEAYTVIRELVVNPAQAEVMGGRARAYAARYSWESIAQSHLALYRKLVPGNAAAPERVAEEQTIA